MNTNQMISTPKNEFSYIHFHFSINDNIGDAAVVYGIRELLSSFMKIKIYTSMSILYLCEFDKMKNRDSDKVESEIFEIVYFYLKQRAIKLLKLLKRTDDNSIIKLINKHDFIVVGGGGLFSKWTLPFNYSVLERIKIPIIVFGAGINSNFGDQQLSIENLDSIKALVSRATLTSVRDETTQKILKTLGCNSILIGDPAISLSTTKTKIIFRNKLKIGVNIACHNWALQNDLVKKVAGIYIRLLNKLSQLYDIDVYYLQHTSFEKLAVNILSSNVQNLTVCNVEPKEMKDIYSNMDLVISMMLHSSIFAYSTNVDFINIAYDIKNYSFMRLIGKEDNIIDVRELTYENILSKCLSLKKRNSSKKTPHNLKKIQNDQRQFVKNIQKRVSNLV